MQKIVTYNNHFTIGKTWEHHNQIDSTNDYLKRLINSDPKIESGYAVSANYQTKGKGQQGSQWQSKQNDNILLSLYLELSSLKSNHLVALNKLIAIATHQFVSNTLNVSKKNVAIKWPNDILVDGSKICGILIENTLKSNGFSQVIIGIGLNVNQLEFDFPYTTSLSIETTKRYDLTMLTQQLLSILDGFYLKLTQSQDYEWINIRYHENLYLVDKVSKFELLNGEEIYGKIKLVDENGNLLVEINEKVQSFVNKEIKFLR